jgi:hypothetical protein
MRLSHRRLGQRATRGSRRQPLKIVWIGSAPRPEMPRSLELWANASQASSSRAGEQFGEQVEASAEAPNTQNPNKHGLHQLNHTPSLRLGAGRSQVQILSPRFDSFRLSSHYSAKTVASCFAAVYKAGGKQKHPSDGRRDRKRRAACLGRGSPVSVLDQLEFRCAS